MNLDDAREPATPAGPRPRARRRRRAALLLLGAAALGCGSSADPPAHLILISLDTLRADRLGAYGYARETSPTLDRIAAEGVLFEQAWATSSWTIPSHASLLTGLYPRSHGLRYGRDELPGDVETLAEILSARGFATAAIVNVPLLDEARGFRRGFESFASFFPQRTPAGSAPGLHARALAWLRANADRRRFLFLHHYDVHSDYDPAPAYAARFAGDYAGPASGATNQLKRHQMGKLELGPADARHLSDLYDAEIRQLDDDLGRFFEQLEQDGLLEDTLLVITSDHGEEFLEHGGFMHGNTLYEEQVRIPLLFWGAGVPAGVRVATPASLVDVVPTLAGLFGFPAPPAVEGVDLAAYWDGTQAAADREIFFETDDWFFNLDRAFKLGVKRGPYKLHRTAPDGGVELYDLMRDRDERQNLATREPEVAEDLASRLDEFAAERRQAEQIPPLSEASLEQLRALGYVE